MIQNEKEIRGGGAEDSPAARATVARARTLANMVDLTRLRRLCEAEGELLFERICSERTTNLRTNFEFVFLILFYVSHGSISFISRKY